MSNSTSRTPPSQRARGGTRSSCPNSTGPCLKALIDPTGRSHSMHRKDAQTRPCTARASRHEQGPCAFIVQARHSGMAMHGQGIHRVHGHFFVSFGRGQGVHGHGLYGQAPGHGQGTFPPPRTCADMRATTQHRTLIFAQLRSFEVPSCASQASKPLIAAAMAASSKPSCSHLTMVSRVGWSMFAGSNSPRVTLYVSLAEESHMCLRRSYHLRSGFGDKQHMHAYSTST